MTEPILYIIVFSTIVLLMIIQTFLSKLKNPVLGAIVPFFVLVVAFYTYFIAKVEFRFKNVLIFIIPLIWSFEQWYRGRKARLEEAEKEVIKMKAKDI